MKKKDPNRKYVTVREPQTRWTDEEIIDALWKSGGIINEACRALGIPIVTFWRNFRYKESIVAELETIWRVGSQTVIDTVYERAIGGDVKAAALYMRYNPYLKEMGWVPEESKVTIKTEKQLTPDEIKQAAKDIFG